MKKRSALAFSTFSNQSGGSVLFKALGHPLAAEAGKEICERVRSSDSVVYDPLGNLPAYASLYGLRRDDFDGCFVRDSLALSGRVLGREPKPVTALKDARAGLVFVLAFDSDSLVGQVRHLLPAGCKVLTLDEMRIPDRLLLPGRPYLDPLNFATNFAFFRDADGLHTRLTTANYWGSYGAKEAFLWCRLFAQDGLGLLDFEVPLEGAGATVVIDSQKLRQKYGLPEFVGQLFVSVVRGAGHDVVKYILDIDGTDRDFSFTHDANAWPADLYAGLPAPEAGEEVVLWVQNSHPATIPAKEIGLGLMGEDPVVPLDEELAPFASRALSVRELLPDAGWPGQIEIHAGKWFVRPRYEVIKNGRRRINHPNVERTDLKHDQAIVEAAGHLGKGFILPAPILPPSEYRTECLPTPMSTAQTSLPLKVLAYDAGGHMLGELALGNLPRNHRQCLDVDAWIGDQSGTGGDGGHLEVLYDLSHEDVCTDGWLHALFRYTDRKSGHAADTSFGAHLFNHPLTFRNEPQSYKGPPPGLSTRLFLRLLPGARIFCQLIYPVCHSWHAESATRLELHSATSEQIAVHELRIPAQGSRLFFVDEMFSALELAKATDCGYVVVRDSSCRLFGYHGARLGDGFALDHMFGF